MLGSNAQRVYLLLLEAINSPPVVPNLDNSKDPISIDEMFHQLVLADIVDTFILPTAMDKIKIFDAVSDAYAQTDGSGIERFIDYYHALKEDKKNSFSGIIVMIQKRNKTKLS